jgi:hypothetical protein
MSTASLLPSNRAFQVWEYQVSHANLLIRSPQKPASVNGPAQTTNIDIHFQGVDYFALPRQLHGLEFGAATQEDIEYLQRLLGKQIAAAGVHILLSEGRRFEVVADAVSVTENDWDIFDSPIQFRSQFHDAPTPDS